MGGDACGAETVLQRVLAVGISVGVGASIVQELPFLLVPKRYFSKEEEEGGRTWLTRLGLRVLLWVTEWMVALFVLFDIVLWLVEASGLLVPYREGGFDLIEKNGHADDGLLVATFLCVSALCVLLWTTKHPLCEGVRCECCDEISWCESGDGGDCSSNSGGGGGGGGGGGSNPGSPGSNNPGNTPLLMGTTGL
jgi:hypothetical protein